MTSEDACPRLHPETASEGVRDELAQIEAALAATGRVSVFGDICTPLGSPRNRRGGPMCLLVI